MTRKEAIKELELIAKVTMWNARREAVEMAIEALSAEAVKGKWIVRSYGGRVKYPWWESCECNKCGEYGSGAYNYCPNCGARMTKGGDDE